MEENRDSFYWSWHHPFFTAFYVIFRNNHSGSFQLTFTWTGQKQEEILSLAFIAGFLAWENERACRPRTQAVFLEMTLNSSSIWSSGKMSFSFPKVSYFLGQGRKCSFPKGKEIGERLMKWYACWQRKKRQIILLKNIIHPQKSLSGVFSGRSGFLSFWCH